MDVVKLSPLYTVGTNLSLCSTTLGVKLKIHASGFLKCLPLHAFTLPVHISTACTNSLLSGRLKTNVAQMLLITTTESTTC